MKFSLAIVFALAGFVVAHTSSSSAAAPINTANIPPCVATCAAQAAQTAGCTTSFTDPACLCKNPKFLPAIEPCIDSTCNATDHSASLQLYQSICGTLPPGAANATETALATSGSQSATQPLATSSSSSNSVVPPAGSAGSSAAAVVPSTTSAGATRSSNAAVMIPGVKFAAGGMWAAVLVGGAGIAQLVL